MSVTRVILTKIRGEDYVHPGEGEAVDLVLQKALSFDPSLKDKAALDVGSGFGGTADYLHHQGFKSIYGIDSDQAAVAYAQKQYPSVQFKVADALDIDKIFSRSQFSFIYFFNVMYAIEDKRTLLKKIGTVARPGCILAVFDYSSHQLEPDPTLKDLVDARMYSLHIDTFQKDLELEGWGVLEITDLTSRYVIWYKNLLLKLAEKAPLLAQDFLEKDITTVREKFTFLLDQFERKVLSGTVIYAKKKGD